MKQLINEPSLQVSEIELSYRPKIKPSLLPKVSHVQDAYALFLAAWDTSKLEYVEQFKVMLLNRGKRVLGISTLSSGSNTCTVADPRQVFSLALITNAVEIIIAHNHPSGCTKPSQLDEELTNRMKQAGYFLDIKLIDHLIITPDGYYSFAEEGAL